MVRSACVCLSKQVLLLRRGHTASVTCHSTADWPLLHPSERQQLDPFADRQATERAIKLPIACQLRITT